MHVNLKQLTLLSDKVKICSISTEWNNSNYNNLPHPTRLRSQISKLHRFSQKHTFGLVMEIYQNTVFMVYVQRDTQQTPCQK